MQFLQYLETLAANLTSSNIGDFITLTENLISLAESVFDHQAPSDTQVSNPQAPSQSSS
jgi:hypothetical protein